MKTSASICKWLAVSLFAASVATGLTNAQPSNCTPKPTGLVSWWKAEGNGLDSISGNTAYAPLLQGGAGFAAGEVGQAFQLDNTNAFLIVPASSSLDVGAGSGLTMEGWIKVGSVSGLHPIAEWHGNTRTSTGVNFWLNTTPYQNGSLFASIIDTNETEHRLASAEGMVQPNVFQHVAVTYDKASGVGTLYLNGAIVAQSNFGTFVPATTADLWIAHRTLDVPGDWTYGATLGGLLDELSIYNRALGSNEIASIYNAGAAGKCDGVTSGVAPTITQQPTNQTVAAGGNATFTVTATGTAPLSYAWYGPASTLIAGATNSTLTLSNVQQANAGTYFVLVTNSFGSAQSSNAVLSVTGSGPVANLLVLPNYCLTNQIVAGDGSLNQASREQMVYAASQFPSNPIVITQIHWRPDANAGGPLSITISNLQIKLSTTVATPDHLSTIFAQNTGSNETVVFNGVTSVSSGFTTLSNGTKAFDISLTLQTPFLYDPSKGNLLVDLLNQYGCTPPRTPQFNIANGTGGIDAVSRVFSVNPNATNAEVADTGGDVLQIVYTNAPSGGSNSCTPAPSGIVAWWPGENNGNDVVGSNNAVLENAVTFAPGEVGQAFQLVDYTNGWMHVPASASLNVGAGGGFTVEGWIKVASVDGFHPIFEWHGATRYDAGVQLWLNSTPWESGALFASVVETNHNTHNLLSADGIVLPNVFQHVALTYDKASGLAKVYLNGTVVAQTTAGNVVPLTGADLYFGHRPLDVPGDWTYGTTLGGSLDEFAVYNRALGSNEIAAIYNAGSNGKCGVISGTAPVITQQPTNQTVAAGGSATFKATATGTAPLRYVWYGPANTLISGATNSTLTLSNVQQANSGTYFVLVTNSFGSAQSSNAVLTVTGGGNGTNTSCTPPPSGLVALWRGENNTLDSVGSNNGNVVGGSIAYAVGEVENAFRYTNNSGYVTVPASSSLNVGQGSGFTLEAWIQPADLVNQMPIFEWQYNTNNNFNGPHFWVSSINGPGCLFANIVDSSNTSHWIYSSPGILTSNYQHVALTYDKASGVASIYRNGALVASTNFGSFTPYTTGNLLLGERTYLGGQPTYHYVGALDEMSVYSRALGQSEIAAIYNAGTAGKCDGSNSGGAPALGLILPNYSISNQVFNPAGTLNQPLREQMVYGASQFPSNPIVITELRWRPDVNVDGPLSVAISNLQVKLSTTVATPDHLSTIFTQNTGTNETLAFSGATSISTAFITLSNGTKAFDISLKLQTPFVYDPSKGNLLVDVLNLYGCTPPRTPQYNIVNCTGLNDAVSRVFSVNPTATNAETADTGGDVLQIIYTNAPIVVGAAPVITQQPTNQTVSAGGNATFKVTATGTAPLRYMWYGPASTLIPGATNSTLTLSNVQQANAGTYFVLVTNSFGSAQSSNAVLSVTGGGGGGTNSCTPHPSGLVAWWKGESNTLDSAGSNNGIVAGGTVSYSQGEVNQSFNFDGSSFIQTPDSPQLHFTNVMTVEAWINLSSLNGNYQEILSKYASADLNQNSYTFTIEPGGHLRFNVVSTNYPINQFVLSSTTIPINQWVHVAGVDDGTALRVYVNGQFSGSVSWNGGIFIGNQPLTIGCTMQANPVSYFNGKIDELSLYNRALGSNEIASIYNAGAAGKCDGVTSGVAPAITQQPTNQTVSAGGNATFKVTATGTAPLRYMWYGPASTLIPGATNSTLTLSNVQQANAGTYFVLVTNSFGSAQSSNAVLSVTGGGGGGTNSCTPAPSGIVGWWPGEGNGNDVINGNSAVLESGVTFASGEVGQSFQLLNYTNGWMHVPASSNLNVGLGGGFTVEGWIKVASVDGFHPIFEWHGATRNDVGVTFWLNSSPYQSGAIFASVVETNHTTHNLISADGIVQANVFQHVALTYDKASGLALVYLNGTVVAQTTAGNIVPFTSGDLNFGHRPLDVLGDGTYNTILGGSIDEFAVYNRALGSNEIAAIYNAGSNGKCPPQIQSQAILSPQPVVNMSIAGKSMLLTWPLSAADFVLQSADGLTPPINWTNVPVTLQTNGDSIETTLPTDGGQGYFRLYHP